MRALIPTNLVGFRGGKEAMSVMDAFLENNAAYAKSFEKGDLPLPLARGVAVVACMDARLDVHKGEGHEEGYGVVAQGPVGGGESCTRG
jgi:carbonic anhydrase